MAANNIGCSITSGAQKSHKRTKSPAPRKKLPTNNKKKQNGKNNIKPINNINNNKNNKQNGVYEINFNPSSTSSKSSKSSNSSSNKKPNAKPIPFIAKNAKPLPSKPSYNAYTSTKTPLKKMPLAQPQKVQKYFVPQKAMTVSYNDNKNANAYNNNNNNNQNKNKNKNKKYNVNNDNDDFDPQAYKQNIHRVKNRPAQNSIAGKLLAQQKAEELELMLEEQEEKELKRKANQVNQSPLAAANSFKK